MSEITEELLRKRAEHNEGEIFSLEELSLHQQNIKKIEHLDRWCKDLKILYFHNNLISKIENLSRLKKLEYVNFTLNNIKRIENLEGCESLKKLDFTVNFIGELTSVKNLQQNFNLEELYLTGNPCSDYEGYREYVIVTLPQLVKLDGEKIMKTERILAMQKYNLIHDDILAQQKTYFERCDHQSSTEKVVNNVHPDDEYTLESNEKFWKQVTSFTPESRVETYEYMQRQKRKNNKLEDKKEKPPRKLSTNDGRILNINEPKLDFYFTDDEENNCFCLELSTYKFMDSSLINVDVQPNYVRVLVKGKVFQMGLPKEVNIDSCTVQRSQTTGHLHVTMPMVGEVLKRKPLVIQQKKINDDVKNKNGVILTPFALECSDETTNKVTSILTVPEHCVSSCEQDDFEDNPDVPPLI